MKRWKLDSALMLAAVVLAGCERNRTTAPASAPAARDAVAVTPTARTHMAEHFTRGVRMRDAVIAGNIDGLRQEARWMAEHELTANLAESWRPYVQRMQEAARQARDATDLAQGAAAVGAMAAACGACHAALGGPRLQLPPMPAATSSQANIMGRHEWAAARLWDSLMTPSDEAWTRGAEVMADATMVPPPDAGTCCADRAQVEQLAVSVHQQASAIRTERELPIRGRAYGTFISTCAQCHRAVGATVGARP